MYKPQDLNFYYKKIKRLESQLKACPPWVRRTTSLCKEVTVFPNYTCRFYYFKVQDCTQMPRPLFVENHVQANQSYLLELISNLKCGDPCLQWLQSITTVYFHWSYLALELNTLINVSVTAPWDMQLIVLRMRSLTVQTRTQSTYFLTCLKEVVADKYMVYPGPKSLKLASFSVPSISGSHTLSSQCFFSSKEFHSAKP